MSRSPKASEGIRRHPNASEGRTKRRLGHFADQSFHDVDETHVQHPVSLAGRLTKALGRSWNALSLSDRDTHVRWVRACLDMTVKGAYLHTEMIFIPPKKPCKSI